MIHCINIKQGTCIHDTLLQYQTYRYALIYTIHSYNIEKGNNILKYNLIIQ